ncbi:hypothetical protein BIV57_03355 [Mangrovactinospora gilvigrisea]|uniref:DUF6542 domain-containing protein n=1 Tax=Mangrovactinospora gilvigrisea TaxID=1428644 RepID=A0A1J7BJE5_9ACTN|nr:DUF6542 domain-containing protein [Mangrovactinospora gilvigrisea]OIV38795.1 hypothetical protein BIV57_03355 [Mangrovactinospora gilvigrisea]
MRATGRPERERGDREDRRNPDAAQGRGTALPGRLLRQLKRRGTLTPLGVGVVMGAPVLGAAVLEGAMRGGPGSLFELVFLGACAVGALHVRRTDLLAAPISAPLAFAAALICSAGILGQTGQARGNNAVAVLAMLSAGAPWLFLGTALAGAVVLARFALRPRRAGSAKAGPRKGPKTRTGKTGARR